MPTTLHTEIPCPLVDGNNNNITIEINKALAVDLESFKQIKEKPYINGEGNNILLKITPEGGTYITRIDVLDNNGFEVYYSSGETKQFFFPQVVSSIDKTDTGLVYTKYGSGTQYNVDIGVNQSIYYLAVGGPEDGTGKDYLYAWTEPFTDEDADDKQLVAKITYDEDGLIKKIESFHKPNQLINNAVLDEIQ